MSHLAQKGTANGFAVLDASSQIPAANAPLKSVYEYGGGQALVPANIGPSGVLGNTSGSVSSSNMSAAAKQAALEAKIVGRGVQAGEQVNPNATTLVVTTIMGFNTTAGVGPMGTAKGKVCLLAAAGGGEFNTTTGKVGASAMAAASKWGCYDANGDKILDSFGNEVWCIVTTPARDTTGPYTLRFFSGEFGSGAETAYTMAKAFIFLYGQLFDMYDMPKWADDRAGMADASAVVLAPLSITDAEIALSGITTRSKLPAALVYDDEANVMTGTFTTNGGRYVKVRVLSGSGSAGSTDEMVKLTATGTYTLPTTPADGRKITFKRYYVGTAYSIARGGSDTIDGGTAYSLTSDGEAVTLVYDATNAMWMSC